jgi:hypothetical protein
MQGGSELIQYRGAEQDPSVDSGIAMLGGFKVARNGGNTSPQPISNAESRLEYKGVSSAHRKGTASSCRLASRMPI